MAFDAGEVFLRLGGLFVRDEFDKWNQTADSARAKAKDPINQKLGADRSKLTSDLASADTQIRSFADKEVDKQVGVSESRFTRGLAALRAKLDSFIAFESGRDITINLHLDIGGAEAKLAAIRAEMAAIGKEGFGGGPLQLGAGRQPIAQIPQSTGYQPNFVFSQGPGRDPFTGRFRSMGPMYGPPNLDPYAEGYAAPRPTSGPFNTFSTREDPFARFPGGGGPDIGGGGGRDGGGGGAFGAAAGGWLFGRGGGGGGYGGGYGGRFFGLGRMINPFRYGLHGPFGAVGGAIGLGPEHLIGAAGSVLGSGVGALGGAGVMAAGGLATMAVGGGADAAVTKSTITDTQTLYKQLETNTKNVTAAQQRYNQAVQQYGPHSRQAQTALQALTRTQALAHAQLMQQVKDLGPGGPAELALARQVQSLNKMWDNLSGNARKQSVGILSQFVTLGKDYVGRVTSAAQQNLSIINRGIRPLFHWLEGPEGIAIWNKLEDTFRAHLPTAIHAFTQTIEALLRSLGIASEFSGHFITTWDKLATRWNTMPTQELRDKMSKLVGDFHDWEQLIKYLGKDLYELFHAGSQEGNQIVISITNILKKWNEWETSARGQSFLHTFFEARKQELYAIASVVGSLLGMFGQFYKALQPLVPAVTAFARSLATALGFLGDNLIKPIAQGLGDVLRGFNRITKSMGPFKEAVLVPLGLFLLSWRRFGLSSTVGILKAITNVEKMGVAVKAVGAALRGVGSMGAAWAAIKDIFTGQTPKSGPGATKVAIVEGFKEGTKIAQEGIQTAMGKGGEKAAAEQERGVTKGGARAAAEEETGVAKGGAFAAEEEAAGTAGGGGISALESGAGGAAGAGFLSRLFRRGGATAAAGEAGLLARGGGLLRGLGGGLLKGGLIYGLGSLGADILGHAIGGPAGKDVSSIGSRAAAGAGIGSFLGPEGTLVGGGLGAIFGAAEKFGGVGQTSVRGPVTGGRNVPATVALKDFEKAMKDAASHNNIQRLQSLANEARNVGATIEQMGGKGGKAFIELGNKVDSLKVTGDTSLGHFGSRVIEVQKTLDHWFIDSGRGLTSLEDDYHTHLRRIANDIGLNTRQGRNLARENMDKMVGYMTAAMLDGRVSVHKGLKEINKVMHDALAQGYTNWQHVWKQTFATVTDLYDSHRINTKQWLGQLRNLFNDTNHQIHDETIAWHTKMNQKLEDLHHRGLLSDKQYHNDLISVQEQANTRQSAALAGWVGNEMQAMKESGNWTHAGMAAITDQVNKALQLFGVSKLKGPSAIQWANFASGHGFMSSRPGQSSYSTSGPGVGHQFAGGGILPGREFGLQDKMTLVDPHGRPVAHMAGDEAVLTRHQAPAVDMALNFAKNMGVLPYGSLEEVWQGINKPHGYERGGRLPGKYAWGGYIDPIGGFSLGRTDMGVDASAAPGTPIRAFGTSKMVGYQSNWYSGQPEMVFQLLDGPDRGRYWYVAEQIVPMAHMGQTIRKGGIVARFADHGTDIEIGWAADPSGTTLAQATTGYTEGQVTPAGQSFLNLIHGLPAMPGGGAAIPTIRDPKVQGRGALTTLVQHGLDRTVSAANNYLQKKLASVAGGFGPLANVSGPVPRQIDEALRAGGMNKVAIAGAIGNAVQESSLNPASSSGGAAGLWQWTPPTSLFALANREHRPWQSVAVQAQLLLSQLGGAGVAAMNRAGSPAAAATWMMNNFERPAAWAANLPNRISAANAAFAKGFARGGRLNYSGGAGLPSLLKHPKSGNAVVTVHRGSSRVPEAELHAVKAAVAKQMNSQVGKYWNVPKISFGENGDHHIYLTEGNTALGPGGYNEGNTSYVGTGTPHNGFKVLSATGHHGPWSVVFSHEMLEMMAGKQIADAVERTHYLVDGVTVSDFVTPEWYRKGSHGPYDWLRTLKNPHEVSFGGYYNAKERGGWLRRFASGGRLPGFRSGGSLYSAGRPSRRPRFHHQHTSHVSQFPESILRDFPDLGKQIGPFAGDDAQLAKLQNTYSREQTVFGLYDPSGMTAYDLNRLFHLDLGQWSILRGEYDKLPNVLNLLHRKLHGPRLGTGSTAWQLATQAGDIWGGDPQANGKRARARLKYERHHKHGMDPRIGRLEEHIADDEDLIWRLNKRVYHDERSAAVGQHNITAQSQRIASTQAAKLGQYLDQKNHSTLRWHQLTDQIDALMNRRPRLHGKHSSAEYIRAHAQYDSINKQIAKLKTERQNISDNSSRVSANISKLYSQNRSELTKLRGEGYALAWKLETERAQIGEKVKKLEHQISEMKKKLAREEAKERDYQKAYDLIRERLYGGGKIDPSASSVKDQMADVGLDILSLQQQGAHVPHKLVSEIDHILKSLGVLIPPGTKQGGEYAGAAAALQDFLNFQAARSTLFQSFGSNFVAAGVNPMGTPAGVAAGLQYYGAASGFGGVGSTPGVPAAEHGGYLPGPQRGGDTNFNIEQHFNGMPDPHTQSAGLRHELNALV